MASESLPVVADPDAPALADVIETVVRAALTPVVSRLRTLEKTAADFGTVGDQIAALGAVAPAPGPPGPAGPAGPAGLGFDDYQIDFDGERTITHRWQRGDARAETVITLPTMIYRGVHVAGKLYERGDCVTCAGSLWHCNGETIARPGDGSSWTLAVKRGRDASK